MSSNDLTQIRGYINSRLPQVNSDYREWKDSIADIGNIPRTLLDNIYHITLATSSGSPNSDSSFIDTHNVLITIYQIAPNTPVVFRDMALQRANCIRLDLLNPLNVQAYKSANDGNIEDIQATFINTSEIDITNDNIIKVEIGMDFRLFFATT